MDTSLQGHVLLLDLDRFKPVNDTFGHAAGDEVLRTVAQRLLACVRDSDTVVRLGGDEFAIVAPSTVEASDADALVTRIQQALTRSIPWRNTPIRIAPSIGLMRFDRDDCAATALLRADADMYRAKAMSRKPRP
ncbi:MAG: diguanylate cyclase [Castellaniella sp.]|nr:GGDEF domain-containing protein [Castellaniella sp.]